MTAFSQKYGEADELSPAARRQIGEAVSDAVSGLKSREVEPPRDPDAGKFKVTGPGYAEQFTSKKQALKAYEALKNRLRKNEQAATIKLSTQAHNSIKWVVEQELKVNEDHY